MVMNINKAHWTTDGNNLKFSMPIGKVDQERRLVSGFATLDNIDKQGDIVDTQASLEAFKKFRGNLREMHQPAAVGKVVSFKEDKYFDPATKKFYNGVFVSAYVSKGAQDTWEKVLDGTLTGFSIGGNITKSDDEFNVEIDKAVRVIKEYELFELSLVDSPANQFANVISIEKVNGENVMGGFLSKAVVKDVYWCSSDDIVQVSPESNADCPSCNKAMKNIGFVENDDENIETIKFLVDSAKGIRTIKMTKEAHPMTDETTVVVEDVVTEEVTPEAPTEEVTNVEVAPETEAAVEVEKKDIDEAVDSQDIVGDTPKNPSDADAEPEIQNVEKSDDEAVATAVADIKDSLTNAFGDLAATVKSISDQVAELSKSLSDVNGNIAAVNNKVDTVASEVSNVQGNFNEFGKRVDKVEADTAFRKSGDLGEIVQEFAEMRTHKSLWGGSFLKSTDLFKR
jgi:hypothetical protein